MKRFAMCLSALMLFAASAQSAAAQDAPASAVAAKRNQTIVDADGRILGKVYDVDSAAGFVTFTAQMKMYRVPLATLSADGSRLKTTMTRRTIGL